jgi:hypothetical protein
MTASMPVATESTTPSAVPDGAASFDIQVQLDGQPAGHLTLGETTLVEALALLPAPPSEYEGQPRPSHLRLQIGEQALVPTTVYNPWRTVYQLHFDGNDVLVLLVDGSLISSHKTLEEMTAEYPGLHQTDEDPNWTEMQVELTPCVTLIAVFAPSYSHGDVLGSLGYAFTCATA